MKRTTLLTAQKFSLEYFKIMALAEHYNRPQVPIPRKCDECKKPCTSECMCGESFCSRACLRKSWESHKEICETVFENASFDVILTKMEMIRAMTPRERQIAEGIINDVQEAARIEQRKVMIIDRIIIIRLFSFIYAHKVCITIIIHV